MNPLIMTRKVATGTHEFGIHDLGTHEITDTHTNTHRSFGTHEPSLLTILVFISLVSTKKILYKAYIGTCDSVLVKKKWL